MNYELEKNDKHYAPACEIVKNSGTASISRVQRELRIGYNHAARLMEAMESDGIVSTMNANGIREVLTPNVKLTGAARLYRAASSDRRERG